MGEGGLRRDGVPEGRGVGGGVDLSWLLDDFRWLGVYFVEDGFVIVLISIYPSLFGAKME